MTEGQSAGYKWQQNIEYLGDFPGAEREHDRLRVYVARSEALDVTDRVERALGKVTVDGTPIVDALASEGVDHLLVGQADGEVWSVTQDAPVEVGTWSAGVLAVQEDTALDVSGATVPVDQQGVIDVSSRDGRNLGDVDVTDLPDADYVEAWAATLAADGSNEYAPTAVGADTLDGRVRSSGTYDAVLEWQDSAGNVVESVDLGTGVAGGTWTDITGEAAITPYPVVRLTDTSSAEQTADAALHLR